MLIFKTYFQLVNQLSIFLSSYDPCLTMQFKAWIFKKVLKVVALWKASTLDTHNCESASKQKESILFKMLSFA